MTIKAKLFLLCIIIFGLFMRTYQSVDRFYYNHDNDLSSWIVKDIVVDHHFRLIGQLTSSPGIFIGPFFYYALIPFYLFSRLDPIGALGLSFVISLASLTSVYFVFSKVHSRSVGIVAALLFAASFSISATERQIVPTTPVFLWSIWFYYFIHHLFQGHPRSLIPLAVLFALVWHIHLALALLAPLVVLGILANLHRFRLRDFFLPVAIFLLLSLPLLVFETRHGFIQTKSLFTSFGEKTPVSRTIDQKVIHVLVYVQRDLNALFWDRPDNIPENLISFAFIGIFIYLCAVKVLSRRDIVIYSSWFLLYLVFFSLHPINLSEYYLDGLSILWIALAARFLSVWKLLAVIVLMLFLGHNLYREFSFTINRSGYVQRKAVVAYIAADAAAHHYPCVSVSYITSPGNDLGYRYLFWLTGLPVNRPQGGAPVYSVVFPLSLVSGVDKTFGALGLVLPKYARYTLQQVAVSCSGGNDNLTYPMFGFTN